MRPRPRDQPVIDDRAGRWAGHGAAFAATIDDAGRFAKSRTVSAYFGLTSRRNQSGEMDYLGCISKFGDSLMRSLLYEAANSLLTVVRKAYPIKD